MTAVVDQVDFGTPTLTAFVLTRNSVKELRNYQSANQTFKAIETGQRGFNATLTLFKPVLTVVDGVPKPVKYIDMGDDEIVYPGEAPTSQAVVEGVPAGQETQVVTMDDVLDADVIKSLRDVLVSVLTAQIPDFAAINTEAQPLGVKRYFHIDKIGFKGRYDKPKEAELKVVIGIYADKECTDIRRFLQQDFLSAAKIEERRKERTAFNDALTNTKAELKSAQDELKTTDITVEHKERTEQRIRQLTADIKQREETLEKVDEELKDLKPMSLVIAKPEVKEAIKQITEAILLDQKARNESYAHIAVDSIIGLFDGAFADLVTVLSAA